MSWIKGPWPFYLLIFLGFWVAVFSIFDIVFAKGWMNIIIALYAILLVLVFFLIFLRSMKEPESKEEDIISEFEKTLKGRLYHFKCPSCSGIFAIKKSRKNDKKYVKMTCPDCGAVGYIPPYPAQVAEVIPEKKSIKANFKCTVCGEGVTVWAEGTDLYPKMCVHSCPYCGEYETMKRV